MNNRFFSAQHTFEFYYHLIIASHPFHKPNFAGTKAIFNEAFTIVNPLENIIETEWRKWKEDYARLEYEWYLSGNRDPAMVEEKAKLWTGMKDEFGFINSNYGYWWKLNNQLDNALELIRKDPETRRAVVVHYNPNEVQNYGKDTPCNIVLNFYRLGNELNLTIFARSIDLVYGFCNDQYCFSRLQSDSADKLGLTVGISSWFITNLHIYPKHWYLRS